MPHTKNPDTGSQILFVTRHCISTTLERQFKRMDSDWKVRWVWKVELPDDIKLESAWKGFASRLKCIDDMYNQVKVHINDQKGKKS